jgi:hypothetical protein
MPRARLLSRTFITYTMSTLTGNEKRKASCKAVGGEKKRTGHKREDVFGERFCDPTATTYKAEADKTITNKELLTTLNAKIGPLKTGATSLKSGKNLQFTLGNIPEITDADDKLAAMSQRELWERYLAKSHSANPASVLCYKTETGWTFFNMDDVIEFIVAHATWRLLPSGRVKGDFNGTQYLTYEYRTTHKSHFLGANGNKGKPFIALLKANLRSVDIQ